MELAGERGDCFREGTKALPDRIRVGASGRPRILMESLIDREVVQKVNVVFPLPRGSQSLKVADEGR